MFKLRTGICYTKATKVLPALTIRVSPILFFNWIFPQWQIKPIWSCWPRQCLGLITVDKTRLRSGGGCEGLWGHLTRDTSQSGLSWTCSVRTPSGAAGCGVRISLSPTKWVQHVLSLLTMSRMSGLTRQNIHLVFTTRHISTNLIKRFEKNPWS